jgi:hypothetical protein
VVCALCVFAAWRERGELEGLFGQAVDYSRYPGFDDGDGVLAGDTVAAVGEFVVEHGCVDAFEQAGASDRRIDDFFGD